MAAEKLAALSAERDDLKTLLLATLKRLEAVDEVAARADVSATVMEEKVGRAARGCCVLGCVVSVGAGAAGAGARWRPAARLPGRPVGPPAAATRRPSNGAPRRAAATKPPPRHPATPQVKALQGERHAAIQAAARAEAEAQELAESRRRLEWQAQLLERMSQVQSKHSRAKSDAIRELLNAEAGLDSPERGQEGGQEEAAEGEGEGEGEGQGEGEDDLGSPTLAAQIAALQRKYLG